QLGTAEGNRSLFPPARLPNEQEERLKELLAAPGQEVIVARFQPATLPLVIVPDRQAALKQRVEKAPLRNKLLGLVKLYTDKVDDSVTSRIYVNAECDLVQC